MEQLFRFILIYPPDDTTIKDYTKMLQLRRSLTRNLMTQSYRSTKFYQECQRKDTCEVRLSQDRHHFHERTQQTLGGREQMALYALKKIRLCCIAILRRVGRDHTKQCSVYTIDNVDNYGRPLTFQAFVD